MINRHLPERVGGGSGSYDFPARLLPPRGEPFESRPIGQETQRGRTCAKSTSERVKFPLNTIGHVDSPGYPRRSLSGGDSKAGSFLWFGYNQYYLYYGFHGLMGGVRIAPSSTHTGRHYKFPPHYVLHGAAGQASEKASINSLGFRGPEFQAMKPVGVFRVICMGESSTFGFRNSDNGTYPFQLENLFRQGHGGAKIEVINAGFPYYNTGSILSLLREELVHYSPDVLTLYSAFNDAGWPLEVGGSR
jgi:hypothetical protein